MTTDHPTHEEPAGNGGAPQRPRRRFSVGAFLMVVIFTLILTVAFTSLLVNIFQRKIEAQNPYIRFVNVTENTTDPAEWGKNWPRQYDSYLRTTDTTHTRYGGSDGLPAQRVEQEPWLERMFSGHAFAIDYRHLRGHAYMLADQEATERHQRPQPGACLHCHSSVMPLYRHVGEGDVNRGFELVNAMPYHQARNIQGDDGKPIVQHPVSCVDCHHPETMSLRVTRPGFINGIRELKAHQGVKDYDVNRDASRQEMRTFTCAQCHVEYYFEKGTNQLVYPWHDGIKVEQMEAYYDRIGFSDWKHGESGAPMLKAQHPEFELWSQGIHARNGVSCADCHMPYQREGAMKVSDHHIRSPLLNIAASCQVCHRQPEEQLRESVKQIQQRTAGLIERSGHALTDMLDAIREAKKAGATEEQLAPILQLHRSAQWRLDFVYAENSLGFHAPQETARILAESIDYARQGQAQANSLRTTPTTQPIQLPPAEPVHGITPAERAPEAPYERQLDPQP